MKVGLKEAAVMSAPRSFTLQSRPAAAGPKKAGQQALSTCWTDVAMARDKGGGLAATTER